MAESRLDRLNGDKMPLDFNPDQFNSAKARIASIFADIIPDLELVGKLAAEAIVRTTLAGIGEGDQAFVPYSKAYQAIVDAVGGKPQQTVNLRGLFYHSGQKRVKFRSEARRQQFREGRQAFVGVQFTLSRRAQRLTRAYRKAGGSTLAAMLHAAVNERGSTGGRRSKFASINKLRGLPSLPAAPKGLALFTARTGITRPAKGVTDPLSEMSLDLIKVVVANEQMKIIYHARKRGYMVTHNNGEGHMPRRKWFSLDNAAVRAAILRGFEIILKARILRAQLNDVQSGPVAPIAEGIIRQAINLPEVK
jgi:hypothetical protein